MTDPIAVELVWADLGVGHVLFDEKTGNRWEIVETALPAQFEYGHSNWLRVVDEDGVISSIPPRGLAKPVTVLIDPTAPPIERSWPTGAKEVALLVEALDCVEIGTQDLASGEVWCEAYHFDKQKSLDHLRLAHGLDVVGLDTTLQIHTVHGQAHNPHKPIGKGGFTHRHMPEDLGFIPA